MLKATGIQALLAEDNLITLERTAHAVRTCMRELQMELPALEEGRLVRHTYEWMIKSGFLGASYEQILEKTRQGLETEIDQEIQGVTATALIINDTSLRMRSKRFWWRIEQHRKVVIAVLFVLFVILAGVVTWQVLNLSESASIAPAATAIEK
ncbi:hypothetical protein [Aminobacter sp. MET-1]|uniref:hypothetical protein n=1 Tax=Aminobacter sp. MET-1 TaxID=2951085 RepID=UPI00226AE336|nr:hypothetical protein [Aminobacter sp. MET-1]MCX8571122.1 hypothetical protein [Aminobacter sp. MET-1]MCX8573209.1 hypothetical protein [Aminobacter sp. MET-1]